MSRWKGLSIVALGSALILVGAACREETPTTGNGDGDGGTQVTTLEEGILTIGTDLPYPPFEYREGGELTGFDVEIMEEIANRLGLEPEWVDSPFDTIFTDLANGQFDVVIAGSTITPEREQEVDFSNPYFRSLQALVVMDDSGIGSFEDLGDGDSVSVQSGTTGEIWAEENLEPNGVEIRAFPEYPPVYNALEAGQVDGVVYDESSAIPETFNRPGTEVVDTVDTNEFYGIAVDPNNDDLLDAVNQSLQEMIDDGTYDEIYGHYPNCLEEEVETCMVPGGNVAAEA